MKSISYSYCALRLSFNQLTVSIKNVRILSIATPYVQHEPYVYARVLQVDFIKNCGNDSRCDSNLLVRGILQLDRFDLSSLYFEAFTFLSTEMVSPPSR